PLGLIVNNVARPSCSYVCLLTPAETQQHSGCQHNMLSDLIKGSAHDRCESVVVSLYSGGSDGLVHHPSSEQMCFVQDLALDMAQFLLGTVGEVKGTEGALLLNECQIPLQECEKLDQSLALAIKHLRLPPDWSLLGDSNALEPQETLLHFAARRGLKRVASFLLKQPGARQALALPNREGATPATLAQGCGHSAMLELLTQEETSTQDSTETCKRHCSGAYVVQHHPDLNTYTLSVVTEQGTTPPSLLKDVQDLRRAILQNTTQVELPQIGQERADDPEEHPRYNSVNTAEEQFMPDCEKRNENKHPDPLQCQEADGGRCLSTEASASISDNGNSDEERACSCENIDRDYGAQVESVAAGIQRDSSDSLQSSSEGESAAPSCGKEQEETDRAHSLICEAQQSAKGPGREVQEEGCSLVRADEDQHMELSESAAGDMGITQSVDTPECSDQESCSQGEESSDSESEVGNKNRNFETPLEQEETEGIKKTLATEQSWNDEQESNEADLQSASPFVSADMIHPVDDKHEINASQTLDSYELGTKEQENTEKDNTDAQEEDTHDSSCHDAETESRPEQFDTTFHHKEESDITPYETCQKNNMVEELQALVDAETNPCSSGFELDDSFSVTIDTISQNIADLPEPEPDTANREADSTVISETTAGSESEGQTLECSTDISLATLGSQPESSTPSSEDALEPEETELVSANMVQRVSASDPQEVSKQNSLTLECEPNQISEWTEDSEERNSLKTNDRTEENSSKIGDGLPETSDVLNLKNSEVNDQEDRATSPNSLVSEETVESRTTEGRLIIIKEDIQPCFDHNESVLCHFSTDIVDGSLSPDESSRLRNEDGTEPEVVHKDSAVKEWTEAKETKEVEHKEEVDGQIKAHREGEMKFSIYTLKIQ
ncbi:A-kinase anchor protein 13 isoform X3, partial [Tachysurus ichikawai]